MNINKPLHIIIIGGGIAGLSAATILCQIPNIKITIYEKEERIGGQASSMRTEYCYDEYSWRIFGKCYHNLMWIINQIGISNNFEPLSNPCFVDGVNAGSADLRATNQIKEVLKYSDWETIQRYLKFLFISKERAINEYDNINAYEYFGQNQIIKAILGPFMGMEANKLSLSGALKNAYSVVDNKHYSFSPETTLLSKMPTQEALFDPWEKYLIDHGVMIHKNSSLTKINTGTNQNNQLYIRSIEINGTPVQANEYIFACSIKPLNQVIISNPQLRSLSTFTKMRELAKDGLQLYFTINMYFSKLLGKSIQCSEMVITDMPWIPIIQKKRLWPLSFRNKCQFDKKQIADIWNVGFLDYNKGILIKKFVRDCSVEEAVIEGIYQVKNSSYIKSLLKNENMNFDDIFIGYEYWYQFMNGPNGKIIVENPKFSTNVGTLKNMPSVQPIDIPINMYLSGYYVNSTMGGASMEASCETGMTAGKKLLDKYRIKQSHNLPIKHENETLSLLTLPWILLDKLLYKLGAPAITDYINPIFLLILYIILIIFLIVYGVKYISKKH
jgi:hypothetical protein